MKYAIAAGHEETARAARDVLEAGGNTFDAAIAAILMSFISEPCMSSAGGGGYALIKLNGEEPIIIDFFCHTPHDKPKELEAHPVVLDFGKTQETFYYRASSVAAPGSLAGVHFLHKHFASIPLPELAFPSIQAAKEGVVLDAFQRRDMSLLRQILAHTEQGSRLFFSDQDIKPIGSLITMPHWADYLDFVSRDGIRDFYEGEVAQAIDRMNRELGGALQLKDLTKYQVQPRRPIRFGPSDYQVFSNPIPSRGGMRMAHFLGLLKRQEMGHFLSRKHTDQLHGIFKRSVPLPFDQIVQEASEIWQTTNRIHSNHPPYFGGTTHFNIVDGKGNGCAVSLSNGEGSGLFIPGTDIQLNNMLGELALLPDGVNSWMPNIRLASMMAPTLLNQKGKEIWLGSGGAGRIPYAIGQVIHHLTQFSCSLHDSIQAPRVHLQQDVFHVEPDREVTESEDVNVWPEQSLFFGGVHAVSFSDERVDAVGDARRSGVVILKND